MHNCTLAGQGPRHPISSQQNGMSGGQDYTSVMRPTHFTTTSKQQRMLRTLGRSWNLEQLGLQVDAIRKHQPKWTQLGAAHTDTVSGGETSEALSISG